MTDNRQDFLRSNVYHFSVLIIRAILVLLISFLFYRLIIMQADIFSSTLLFTKSWVTLYSLSVAGLIFSKYISDGVSPFQSFRRVIFKSLPLAIALGVFVFYLLPFALPLIT